MNSRQKLNVCSFYLAVFLHLIIVSSLKIHGSVPSRVTNKVAEKNVYCFQVSINAESEIDITLTFVTF